jgi:hypothetical protein
MLSCCVIFGNRRCKGDNGVGRLLWPSQWFDSDTTRSDFSKTFHSLMVLSVRTIQDKHLGRSLPNGEGKWHDTPANHAPLVDSKK